MNEGQRLLISVDTGQLGPWWAELWVFDNGEFELGLYNSQSGERREYRGRETGELFKAVRDAEESDGSEV